MLLPMCRASATSACLAVHATHARAVVAAEAATATATTTTTTARWAQMLTPEAAWAWRPTPGQFLKIAGDAGDCDGDYGESGTSGPGGMDLDLGGDACGSDGDGGEDGSMGLEADAGAVSEVEGGADCAGEAAAPAAAFEPGTRGNEILVAPDKKKKKKRGSRGGQLQRLTLDQRKASLRARDGDDRR
jgi:hypothetical protein